MRRLERLFDLVVDLFAVLAGAVLVAVTLGLAVNVGLRALAGTSLFGMVDAIELGLMAATFLAAPWVLRKNAHVAVDIVLMGLPPAARRGAERGMAVVGALLCLVLSWASGNALLIAWGRGSMMRGVLDLPEWIPLAAPTLGGFLLALEFLRRAIRGVRAEGRQQAGL